MTEEKTTTEMLERERYPFGKPRPYTPDHPNLLAEGLFKPPVIIMPLFSSRGRGILMCLAILLATYGCYGLMTDNLYIPGKRSIGKHYHGVPALLMFCAIISFSSWLIAAALSKIDSARHQLSNQLLLNVLLACVVVFMLAAITVNLEIG